VLDIGGSVGALVLYTPASMLGSEIEIESVAPDGLPAPRVHSAVRERDLPGGGEPIFAAVYPHLLEGVYRIDGWSQTLRIAGGRITEVTLPTEGGSGITVAGATRA
jgi:hypothetical protein